MSKVGGALPSWYWPAGIPRRVAVPQQPIARLLRKTLGAAPDGHALWTAPGGWVSNARLLDAALGVCADLQANDAAKVVAVVEPDPAQALTLLLGAWLAGRQVCLPAGDTERLRAQLAEAQAALVLTAREPRELSGLAGVPVMRAPARAGAAAAQVPAAGRATDPALLIPAARGLVVHSHFSLSAMATALSAFIKEIKDLSFLCTTPLGTWEALTGAIGALLRGRSVLFTDLAEPGCDAVPIPAEGLFSILCRADVDRVIERRRAPQALRGSRYVFVSTGAFKPAWRRRLEAWAGKPILPLWGMPEIGPAVVAHPTWYPVGAHGFPLVNVSIVPVDPDSGRQSVVPWEMLTSAEMGVESLSAMLGYARPGQVPDLRIGKVVRTGQIANIDHVGVVTLHHSRPTGGGAPDAG
ncbi:MAG: AMP-binding protein [Gammaproteobacteria bacterium]|nr:AMP-binding protein [Gammaproteobacteria bacterium]